MNWGGINLGKDVLKIAFPFKNARSVPSYIYVAVKSHQLISVSTTFYLRRSLDSQEVQSESMHAISLWIYVLKTQQVA